jgi:prepilin-type N-terminal cleavage/methylation domain-containing protein/prepilin-type processing-associated H-X9-DG protein
MNRSLISRGLSRGFTLIELLVVIAIIALLVSILLPALSSARNEARATKAASNARSVAIAVFQYNAQYQGRMPPAYVYGADQSTGAWRLADQQETNPNVLNGYVHWSSALFDDARSTEAFQSPALPRGGAPATNPGPNIANWEPNQANDANSTTPSDPPYDRQVARVAFAPNGAIIPRNKFNVATARKNRLPVDVEIQDSSKTILIAEFASYNGTWNSLFEAGTNKSKSHRPLSPLVGLSGGNDPRSEPIGGSIPRFAYPTVDEIRTDEALRSNSVDLLSDNQPSNLNAVGRHYPGSKGPYGGTSHFAFCDGHVERLNVMDTVKKRLWGNKYYSLTGTGTGVSNENMRPID